MLTLLAVCGFLFFAGVQTIGLVGADEPRYAQVAREMLERHDWVTPTLFGKPWLEKPPLFYWMAAASYNAAGGFHDWAARLPSAALCALMIFFIYFWLRRFYPGAQLDGALITAASVGIIGFGRGASMDMPLTATFTVAMLCWFAFHKAQSRAWLLGFYLALGLGTLAKGPVAVFLAALVIVPFAALRRDWRLLLRTMWPFGIVLYLAVALPWFIAVQRANPEFFRVFILQHNLARYTTDLYRHRQPFWYFIPVAVAALLPWIVFVIGAVVDAYRDWRYSSEQPAGEEDLRLFLSLWLVLPIVFFSLSQSKLPGYILPAIPAGTILLADYIRRRELDGDKPVLWMVILHAVIAAGIVVAAFIVPFKLLHLPIPMVTIAVAVALAVTTLASLTLTIFNHGFRFLRLATLVPLLIAFALVLKGTAPIVDALESARTVQASLQHVAFGNTPTIAVYDVPRSVEYGLGFYRNHPVLSYERNEIPEGQHLVVAAAGTRTELLYRLGKRTVVPIGGYSPQNLDFYFISAAQPAPHQ